MTKSSMKWVRCTVRVLRMFSELHRMGHQRLRMMPYEEPTSYRVWIAPAHVFSRINGAYCQAMDMASACYYAPEEDA